MTGNENIRIGKVLKEFNIGMGTLVEFLRKKGIDIDSNPGAKLSGDQYALVAKEFKKEQIVKEESCNGFNINSNNSMTHIVYLKHQRYTLL